MASTYTPIATQTLESATATVTFNSIPSTYTDLVLVCETSFASNAINSVIRFNSDSSSLYSRTYLVGLTSSVITGRETNQNSIPFGYIATAGQREISILQIMNYSNSTTFKTVLSRENNGQDRTSAVVSLYRNTSAITSITLTGSANYVAGSIFSLYGIKAA